MMTQNFFVYGPLGDPELLEVVLGRPAGPGELVAARAMRRVVRTAAGAVMPALVRADGEAAPGALLQDAGAEEAARLAFFHGAGAEAQRVNVSAAGLGEVEAVAFAADAAPMPGDEAWSVERWRAGRRAYDIEFARDWMSQYGRRPIEEMAGLAYGMGFRAHARATAAADDRARHAPTGLRAALDRSAAESLGVARPYMEFFAVEDHLVRHRKFDGSMTPVLKRSVFFTGDAVTILPYDPALDRVLLIEQWRAGPWARGDRRPWCLEVVAGRVDPGESPEATAIREAREEASVDVSDLQRISAFYPTPGIAAEKITAFVGRADLSGAGGVHGLDSEDEDIRVLTPTFQEAMAMLAAEEVDNAPAIISLMWLASQREALRARWGG